MTRWNPTVSFHVNITPLDDRSPNTPAGPFRPAQKTQPVSTSPTLGKNLLPSFSPNALPSGNLPYQLALFDFAHAFI